MTVWDDILTDVDRQVLAVSGHGASQGLGARPAVLVIDVTYNFTGEVDEPVVDAARRSRNACGHAGWEAVRVMRTVLDAARRARVPVVYSLNDERRRGVDVGRWGGKNARASAEDTTDDWDRRNRIVDEIAPASGDLVLRKAKPSVFFGTALPSYLVELRVDTLIVMGGVTSGCIRASVVDAFSYNYRVGVVVDGTFDRYETSHKVNLFDMHAKYADLMPASEVITYLDGIRARSESAAR
jgi:maleamate amidohydrolase